MANTTDDQPTRPHRTTPGELAVDPAEAGRLLGLSRRSVDRAIGRGELRAVHVGGRVIVPRVEIDRLLGITPHE